MSDMWRCRRCGKRLGDQVERKLHICSTRGLQYMVQLPVECVCPRCDLLNVLDAR